ncbi:alanine--tRNA ligase [Kamptonema cortianum]|nr:alanine--tRNA ligase [Kamptonema cortianum]MDL5049763.1 alanine--tRNA ligase [Oscillatoria amoena NRMC-F 0135]
MKSADIRKSFLDFFHSKGHSIVPSSSLMPDSPNLLFTNAGMNQFVPIFLGQSKCPYSPPRAADTQKCIRAGGKHNDLEDVGLDTYHHTFFEMLGNWSFGDYFKKEAISWAWELVTEVWKFPVNRLYATVYKPGPGDPAAFDQEAYDFWAEQFARAGLDPKVHIVMGNKKDNFWMMGETGPCGPCSELHVDLTPAGDTKGTLVNAGSAQCMEIWNLVFIQFNANADGSFSNLPAQHVDTGAGFERISGIIQCTKNFTDFSGVISNYETDVFRPLFDEIEKFSGKKYTSTLPKAGSTGDTGQEKIDVAFRVIADHIRTLSFAIADGILPGNNDRNYVLRRILRRAVRYGRTLGLHEPFFYKLVAPLAEHMGDVFPEIRTKQDKVRDTIRQEEESFNRTLDKGIQLFEAQIHVFNVSDATGVDYPGKGQWLKAQADTLPGFIAFELYDTYGFPLDLTELMAREKGLKVDTAGFEKLMEEQRARARAAQKKEIIEVTEAQIASRTEFLGFDQSETEATVLAVQDLKGKQAVITDKTVFYAEMGGQVGDTGLIGAAKVVNTIKAGDTFLHILAHEQIAPEVGQKVVLKIDKDRRGLIEGHHSGTHLFHWALHEVVSKDATQKGSYVGPDRLRFDFNSGAVNPEQIARIERLVNEKITAGHRVQWSERSYDEVKGDPTVMQMFGEKYGDTVRVVDIGGYSKELCGGTHVRSTTEIGYFKVISEGAVAAGIRRIEAVAGAAAEEYFMKKLEESFSKLREVKARLDAAGLEVPELPDGQATGAEQLSNLHGKITGLIAEMEEQLAAHEKSLAKERERLAQIEGAQLAEQIAPLAEQIAGVSCVIQNVKASSPDTLKFAIDALKGKFDGVILLASDCNGKAHVICSIHSSLTKKIQAGNVIKQIAPVLGGGGGGKPDLAQAGGKNPEKIDEALVSARKLLADLAV